MKKSHNLQNALLMALGIVLLGVGFIINNDSARTISGLCIGIGAGLVGMNLANFAIERYYQKNPQVRRHSEIDSRDERTQFIAQRAKARAYDVLVRVMMVIPFLLILIDAPLWATLATVGIYLFGFGVQMYFTVRYNQEM